MTTLVCNSLFVFYFEKEGTSSSVVLSEIQNSTEVPSFLILIGLVC
jgi:hypothetical protein